MVNLIKSSVLFLLLLIPIFQFAQPGKDCSDPYVINSLPFVQTGMTTQGFGDEYDENDACNSVFMYASQDFVFQYIPPTNQNITVRLTNTTFNVGLFIIKNCPDDPNAECVVYKEEYNGNPVIYNIPLLQDSVYYIVISTYNTFNLFPYTPFDIEVNYSYQYDVTPYTLYDPKSGCVIENIVNLYVKNYGYDTISNFDIGYTINNGPPVIQTFNFTLPPYQEQNFSFTVFPDFSYPDSTYHLEVFTMLPNDENPANDTLKRDVYHTGSVSTFPYYEDFEVDNGGWGTSWRNFSTGSSWELGQPNGAIIDTAHSGTNAWVTNLNGNTMQGEKSYLISPCFDFSGMILPIVDFWIWYETESWEYFNLEYSLDSCLTWHQLGSINSGTNWYNTPALTAYEGWYESSGGWLNAIHPCTGLGGEPQVHFRINYEGSTSTTKEGFALDDFRIYESPLNDVGISRILKPNNDCGFTSTDTVKVMLMNYGLYDQDTIQLFYSLDNGNTYVYEYYYDTLAGNDSTVFVFSTLADLSQTGSNEIICGTFLNGDSNSSNDTLIEQYFHFQVIDSYPYLEDFENDDGGWMANGLSSSWEHGIPTDTIIDTAASGTHAWVTNLSGYHNQGELSYLYTPCFDFSGNIKPVLHMKIWYDVINFGTQFQYWDDVSGTWKTLGSSSDPNWYNQGYNWLGNSSYWVDAIHDLSMFAGHPQTKFRFKFTGVLDHAGFAVDDFRICETPVSGFDFSINGLNVTFTDTSYTGSGNVSYYWDFGDSTTSTDISPVHNYLTNDTVTVMHIVSNECYSDTSYATFYVNNIEIIDNYNFSIYPNPANSELYVEYSKSIGDKDLRLNLYALEGKLISRYYINYRSGYTRVNLSNIESGNYLISITGDNKILYKTIIQVNKN